MGASDAQPGTMTRRTIEVERRLLVGVFCVMSCSGILYVIAHSLAYLHAWHTLGWKPGKGYTKFSGGIVLRALSNDRTQVGVFLIAVPCSVLLLPLVVHYAGKLATPQLAYRRIRFVLVWWMVVFSVGYLLLWIAPTGTLP